MKNRNFKIPILNPKGTLREVIGEQIAINEINCFIFYDEGKEKWNVSHLETGAEITTRIIKASALKDAKYLLSISNTQYAIETMRKQLKKKGYQLPINS